MSFAIDGARRHRFRVGGFFSGTDPDGGGNPEYKVEVHATVHDGDVARMRKVEPLHVGAGERVVLEPGGMHLMLMGLRKPLAEGERIPLVLEFEVAGEQRTEIRVFAAGSDEAGGNHHAHH